MATLVEEKKISQLSNIRSIFAWSPNGNFIVTRTEQGDYVMCEIRNDKLVTVKTLCTDKFYGIFTFSPDSRWLVVDYLIKAIIYVCDTSNIYETGIKIFKQDHFCFSLDGGLAATGSKDGTIQIWNTADWSLTQELKTKASNEIDSFVFSPDNQFLVQSFRRSNTVDVWNLQTSRIETSIDNITSLQVTCLSPNGVCIVDRERDCIKVVNMRTHEPVQYVCKQQYIGKCIVSSSGRFMIIHDAIFIYVVDCVDGWKSVTIRVKDEHVKRHIVIDPQSRQLHVGVVDPGGSWQRHSYRFVEWDFTALVVCGLHPDKKSLFFWFLARSRIYDPRLLGEIASFFFESNHKKGKASE